jgi:restriction endonuclease S subunit
MHNKKLLGNYYAHIGQLAFVYRGFTPKPNERKQKGKYLLLGGRNISGGQLIKSSKDAYTDDIPRESFRRAIAKPGDIIVSTLFDKRKLYIFRRSDPQAVVLDSCAIIRTRAVFEGGDDYILSYLRTIKGQEQFLHDAEQATGGEFIPRLSIKDLEAIKVPLLPISDLQRLGDTHIELSTTDELNSLRDELKSKENEVAKLKASNAYLENRLQKIEDERSSKEYALRNRIAHGET